MDQLQNNMIKAAEFNKQQDFEIQARIDKNKLIKLLRTKLNTTFVGSLSVFEESFGFLWGHGKNEHELSENELKWRTLWKETRRSILYNGNSQVRGLETDLSNFDINCISGKRK